MSLAGKLQLKVGHRLAVHNAPPDVDLSALPMADDAEAADAVLLFVANRAQLDAFSGHAVDAARNDRLAWVAYPKGGQLGTDLNRDSLNLAMQERGVQAVRQVSLDEVWSALRFRPV